MDSIQQIKLKWQRHNQQHGMSWNEIAELVNGVEGQVKTELLNTLKAVYEMHPYKIPGDRESYYEYSEGWSDACDEIEGRI